ncbi:anhydro-N-acetylmuramic acid kinase [Methylosoma difficile]
MVEHYIGLMSGTSLDGIDAALVSFDGQHISLCEFFYQPFSAAIKQKIALLSQANALVSLSAYGELDTELGYLFADTAKQLLEKAKVSAHNIKAIGSHGQTVYHSPHPPHPFSLQIGDPNIIAAQTGITTVADFRRRDIAVNGQGAPLVPAFHRAIFHHPSEHRCIVNIGGIANITVLAADDSSTLGFDTGPGNTLMDYWVKTHQNLDYDANGSWAASGTVQQALLDKLSADTYFSIDPPKSTGKEYFSPDWLNEKLGSQTYLAEDVQATLCRLSAQTIAKAIKQHATKTKRVLVCGGGAHNQTLIEMLVEDLNEPVQSTLDFGVHPDHVEAMAFAWLARQTLNGLPGNLTEVTGADKPVVLGGVYQAN